MTMELSKVFMSNLIKYRTGRGLSQKELADRSGISPRMINHYETRVSKPSLDKIVILAEALDVSVFQLLSIDEATKDESGFLSSVDPRTLKQFQKILKLSPADKSTIYKMVDALLEKSMR